MTTSNEAKKIVWVLGAGFSQPLGGPQLPDLLSPKAAGDISRYSAKDFPRLHARLGGTVRLLYELGRVNGLVRLSNEREVYGQRLWQNAEDFIDYIDTASDASSEKDKAWYADRINRLIARFDGTPSTPTELRAMARRLVAAECSIFLEEIDTRREQWRPFRNWMRSLRASDEVITFNYDRVVEKLRDAQNKDVQRFGGEYSRIRVRLPVEEAEDPNLLKDQCSFFKLHGSVDWKRSKTNDVVRFEISDNPRFALDCEDDELALGTPGPSKQAAVEELKPLWNFAYRALENADSVVFLGYRFPETDAFARERLLGAISRNKRVRVPFHIVLGYSDNDAKRLASLLTYARRMGGRTEASIEPVHHRLFGQDFLTVIDRDAILE